MFVLSRNVSASFRVIATLVATALLMWALGLHSFAQAANIQNASDLMTDTSPGADSDHTITFNLTNDLTNGQTVVIDFDQANGFDTSSVTTGDFAITAGAGTFSEAINTTTDIITFTSTGGTVASGTLVTVTVDGSNKINNPSPADGNESYEIDISAGTDTGHTRVVILNTVLVTAAVDTTFNFTVAGVADTLAVNGTTTTLVSSSTTIPFGTLTAGEIETLAQDLTVTTNAINGFVVTVETDQDLLSQTGAIIDSFIDGSATTTPSTWVSPSDNIGDSTTWGHWGVTSEDFDTDGNRTDEFSADAWAGVSTTPQAVFAHSGPADGTTAGQGATRVGYQIEISPLQEAADDYTTTLTYIATPTF